MLFLNKFLIKKTMYKLVDAEYEEEVLVTWRFRMKYFKATWVYCFNSSILHKSDLFTSVVTMFFKEMFKRFYKVI